MKTTTLAASLFAFIAGSILFGESGPIPGNDPGRGGDKVIRTFEQGWRQSMKMVSDAKVAAFPAETGYDALVLKFFDDNRGELLSEIENCPQLWDQYKKFEEFKLVPTLCGYTSETKGTPFYLFKDNCKAHTEADATRHFIGEAVHHFGKDDLFAASVANAVWAAYYKPSGEVKQSQRILELKLLQEAKLGNIHEVEELLAKPNLVNPNCRDGAGRTPIYLAAYDERFEVVKILIRNGARVDTHAHDGMTLFQTLYRYKLSQPQLDSLVEMTKVSHEHDSVVNLGLGWAAVHGNQAFLKIMLALGPTQSGLDLAAETAFREGNLVSFLLLADAKLSEAVLTQALKKSIRAILEGDSWSEAYFDFIKSLTQEYGASVDFHFETGFGPLGESLITHWREAVRYHGHMGGMSNNPVMSQNEQTSSLPSGKTPDYRLAQLLLDAKADVNELSGWKKNKTTPLILAVRATLNLNPDFVKTLVASGADLKIADSDGYTPLDWGRSLRDFYVRSCPHSWNKIYLEKMDANLRALIAAGAAPS
ncbi:MAG: hypothetical protein HYR96_01865, partial [Deltaproteobacteria bacterium]|nr:hypothetical protein [Deltaproteobacteria bacterium]